MVYYSPSTKGFYIQEIHKNTIPADCVQITEEQHKALLDAQDNGYQIVPDENGFPVSAKQDPISADDARALRNTLLSQSDWTQFPDVQGSFTDAQKEAWKQYRQELRDVPQQEGFPNNVIWPDQPQ